MSLRAIIAVGSLALGGVWLVKKLTSDNLGRPFTDSFGQKIDYSHSISYIADTTDPLILARARSSWQLEERIKKENAAKNNLPYTETPFKLNQYYGGYRNL